MDVTGMSGLWNLKKKNWLVIIFRNCKALGNAAREIGCGVKNSENGTAEKCF